MTTLAQEFEKVVSFQKWCKTPRDRVLAEASFFAGAAVMLKLLKEITDAPEETVEGCTDKLQRFTDEMRVWAEKHSDTEHQRN